MLRTIDTHKRVVVGGLTIGKPASNSLCVGVCGAEAKRFVYELNRLYVNDGVDFAESKFIAESLGMFYRTFDNAILVSYADTDMGRRYIGSELLPHYAEIANERVRCV